MYNNSWSAPIPAAPATAPVQLNLPDVPRIEVGVSGQTQPNEIYVNTNAGRIQLVQLFATVNNIAAGVYSFSVLNPSSDEIFILSYEGIDQTTTLPQMYAFPLTDINEIKMDILADVKSTTPFRISTLSTVEPYKTILKPIS